MSMTPFSHYCPFMREIYVVAPLYIFILPSTYQDMITSSNGSNFRVTGFCAGNSPVIGEIHAQRPATRSFDAFFDLRLNEWLSKQSWGWWFETPSSPLWRHSNEICTLLLWFVVLWYRSIYTYTSVTSSVSVRRLPLCQWSKPDEHE